MSAAVPPDSILIAPSFTTLALGLGEGVPKLLFPARKSLFRMSAVVAISPATSTRAPGPKKTPLGLMSHTWPFAVSCPWIALTDGPTTRLRATEPEEGWTNCTLEPLGIEKLCQFRIAFDVLWVM